MSEPQVVVMGISGSGKSTIGSGLAQRLGVPFVDGDDLHPQSNVDKMAAGHPLDDDDRRPWLEKVGAWLLAHPDGGVIACSALKRTYRDLLRAMAPEVTFVHLEGSRELIEERHSGREGHFMPHSMLSSQLATLEPLRPDETGVSLDIADPPEVIIEAAAAALAAPTR